MPGCKCAYLMRLLNAEALIDDALVLAWQFAPLEQHVIGARRVKKRDELHKHCLPEALPYVELVSDAEQQ